MLAHAKVEGGPDLLVRLVLIQEQSTQLHEVHGETHLRSMSGNQYDLYIV